jgi:hypothetical protein
MQHGIQLLAHAPEEQLRRRIEQRTLDHRRHTHADVGDRDSLLIEAAAGYERRNRYTCRRSVKAAKPPPGGILVCGLGRPELARANVLEEQHVTHAVGPAREAKELRRLDAEHGQHDLVDLALEVEPAARSHLGHDGLRATAHREVRGGGVSPAGEQSGIDGVIATPDPAPGLHRPLQISSGRFGSRCVVLVPSHVRVRARL